MSPRSLVLLLALFFLTACGLRWQGFQRQAALLPVRREFAAYQDLRELIARRYVGETQPRQLLYGALQGMAGSLDTHSTFYNPRQYQQAQDSTSGHYFGVGILLQADSRAHALLLTPQPGSPAFKAGVRAGDRLLKVDGKPVEKLEPDEVGMLIRGPKGTPVQLSVQREGAAEALEFTILRAEIKEESVSEACLLLPPETAAARVPENAPKLGYVDLLKFQQDSARDLEQSLAKLEAQGLEGLVLDLRQNPGGLLDVAVEVCDLFLEDGLIVTVRERADADAQGEERVYQAKPSPTRRTYPVAILIDSRSASASEIVSGCLKDRGRAVLVGEKSYGKGSVQTIFPVDLGEWGQCGAKLTTARYFTPSGKCIDGAGIEPDQPVALPAGQLQELLQLRHQRRLAQLGATAPAPPPEGEAPKAPFHDVQLEKAIAVLCQKLARP